MFEQHVRYDVGRVTLGSTIEVEEWQMRWVSYFPGHTESVISVKFGPDGRSVIIYFYDHLSFLSMSSCPRSLRLFTSTIIIYNHLASTKIIPLL